MDITNSEYQWTITLEWNDFPLNLIELYLLKFRHLYFENTDLSITLKISSTFSFTHKMMVGVSNAVHVDLLYTV